MNRRITKKIKVGNIYVGGDHPITVQSMTNTDTRDYISTIEQINKLKNAGCDIVRCAVLDNEACDALGKIVTKVDLPIVADIHFDYRLAINSIKNGVAALRINPGNIGNMERVKAVAECAKSYGVPIRIGVNSGSLEKDLLLKYGKVCPEALVESAFKHIEILENFNFNDIVVSIKSSDVMQMIESYRLIAEKCDYPLHLGVTEAGTAWRGTIKSSIGIGTLLAEGIGDTIRVSLTDDPVEEVKTGKEILKALGYLNSGVTFISCPTCGRTQINLIKLAHEVEKQLANMNKNIKVAVMGCVVNGPGEAREADIGIAGGKGEGLIFKKGEVIKKVKEEELLSALMDEIEKL